MKLFISYARVDKPYCIQIINTLDIHEIWYDQRLHAGQHWWQEILRRLEWADGFVFLLSPESVESEYCQREFELAQGIGLHIFPVLIHRSTKIPKALQDIQYADFSQGLTANAVKSLLNSVYVAANDTRNQKNTAMISPDAVKPPSVNPVSAVSEATAAMKRGQYDQAVFLLKRAQATGVTSRFVNIDAVLAEAEAGLERMTYLREAAREYNQIVDLVRFEPTHKLGCEAFHAFREHFKDYDPEKLAEVCGEATISRITRQEEEPAVPKPAEFAMPLLEWCSIPEGGVEVANTTDDGRMSVIQRKVPAFKISRYPVTNAQYRLFLSDPMGYANHRWWQFSDQAQSWHANNRQAQQPTFKGDERPRERVNWYEAMAFCQWLGSKLNLNITLPTDLQWIRAARGDDRRVFPWGNTFNKECANTRESDVKMTTLVMRYEEGVSPFGVYDMSGNTWEWCLDLNHQEPEKNSLTAEGKRLVHGGSFISPYQRAEINFRYYLDPQSFHSSIGFRIIINDSGE